MKRAAQFWWRVRFAHLLLHLALLFQTISGNTSPIIHMTVINLREDIPVGQYAFTIQATDAESDPLTFSINGENKFYFSVTPSTGAVQIKSPLDREEKVTFNVELTVSDGVNDVVRKTLIVILHDANDNRPIFVDAPYNRDIREASETQQNVHGTISSTTTDVLISIGDVNDNKPRFYNCRTECDFKEEERQFMGNIDEASSVSVPVGDLNIIARDLDEGVNSRFELHLQGPDKDAFALSPPWAESSSSVQILVRNPSDVDYEKNKFMIIEVVAIDTSKLEDCCSTATVTIHIRDVNDNSPAFESETYYLNVDEHSPAGRVVASITATDPDTNDVGKITYRLLPESILKYFYVNPKNGRIKVKNCRLLDREVRSVFSATLQALDSAMNVGTTVVEIILNDINDKTPTIARDSYTGFVKEGSEVALQLQILAFDADEPGTGNSEIRYGIEEGDFSRNFSIDVRTGLLKNEGPLDREAIEASANGVIRLNVTAADMGHPSLSSWVVVTINVEDINDNSPIFKSPSYEFHVRESEKGVFVGSVFARDLDQTEMNNRVSFRVTDGSFGNFLIMAYSDRKHQGYVGDITVDPDVALDYEQLKTSYTLTVEAADLGQRSDFTQVTVNVVDVNDERPALPDVMVMSVRENTTGFGEVGRIVGIDVDTNHSLIYELLTSSCRCSGVMASCEEQWFELDTTGAVLVNEDSVVDYEVCDQVLMEVQAVDVFTERGESRSVPGKLTINIEDINDNVPRFIISETLFVVVAEVTERGTEIARVSAIDSDSGLNMEIKFEVLSVDIVYANDHREPAGKIFYAETTARTNDHLGTIRSLGTLDCNLKARYFVTVQATDCGDPPLQAATELVIYTVDKSFRVGLRFESRLDEINKNMNSIRGALIAATRATVHILEIVPESHKHTRASGVILLESYFVYPNGSAINSDDVERILQEDFYHANILQKYGLTYVVSTMPEVKEIDLLLLVLTSLVASLLIALIVMTMALVYTQKSYKRKLKAARAMNSAAMMSTKSEKPRAVVPGTNRYASEGANPVLNMNIEVTSDAESGEEESSADRMSIDSNSLEIDFSTREKRTRPMTRIREEEAENGNESHYIIPLVAAISQQDMEEEPEESNSFVNPALSTTDL
ncbi:hypothetical protein GJAV_G00125450 [Gymnothorax javanicus]|nr:hypothetical protein GJAV_G00125450 [Gymnothorax javanicus]